MSISNQPEKSELENGTQRMSLKKFTRSRPNLGGQSFSIQKVFFQQGDENFKLLSAYSVTKGKINLVPEKNLQLKTPSRQFALTDLMEVSIPFSNISIGSEVHLRYQSSMTLCRKHFSKVLKLLTHHWLKKKSRKSPQMSHCSRTPEELGIPPFQLKKTNDHLSK